MTDDMYFGPFEYVVVAFPPGSSPAAGLLQLLDIVETGAVEVLDLECVTRSSEGVAVREPVSAISALDGVDLSAFEGVESNILDDEDLATIADTLEEGGFALALVYVSRALDSVAREWVRAGGRAILAGGIDPVDLENALNDTDESI